MSRWGAQSKMEKKRVRHRKEKRKHSNHHSSFYYCPHCKILYTQVHTEKYVTTLSTYNPEKKEWMETLYSIKKEEVKCDLCHHNISNSIIKIPHDVIDFYKIHLKKNLSHIVFSKYEPWDTEYVVGVITSYMFDYLI